MDADVATAQVWARRFAADCGFAARGQWEIALAVSEAASNIVKFGAGGRICLRFTDQPRPVLEIEATDRGPGIPNLAYARMDGVSEGNNRFDPDAPRRFGGLGLGLGTIQRMTDELSIETGPGGTRIVARKHIEPAR